jgi:Tfp pilus assembly protein PilP
MRARWWLSLGLALVLAGLGAPTVGAQGDEKPAPLDLDEEVDVSGIEQILRGDQEVMQGEMFSYDPAGRRDPFRSLQEGFEEEEVGSGKVRPPGLAGMLVEELRVEGIIQTPSGILAFVQGRDNLSYIHRPGTKLYNGEVKEIYPDRVVFKQQAEDPKQIRPYEEVVRELVY